MSVGLPFGVAVIFDKEKEGFNNLINSVEGYLYGFCHFVKKYFVCVL